MAQIVYSGEQPERGQQQVVYAADGTSYAAVEPSEHTLVYIHPADGTQVSPSGRAVTVLPLAVWLTVSRLLLQAVFTDQPQVAYIQQDGTTQQVSSATQGWASKLHFKTTR